MERCFCAHVTLSALHAAGEDEVSRLSRRGIELQALALSHNSPEIAFTSSSPGLHPLLQSNALFVLPSQNQVGNYAAAAAMFGSNNNIPMQHVPSTIAMQVIKSCFFSSELGAFVYVPQRQSTCGAVFLRTCNIVSITCGR